MFWCCRGVRRSDTEQQQKQQQQQQQQQHNEGETLHAHRRRGS